MSKRYGVNMPSTLERSSPQAQRTYAKTLRSAEQEYGPGERAGRTAYASLKHSYEKVGDHWEAKDHKGPSDPQAARRGKAARDGKGPTAGGVDVQGHTRQELYARATELEIRGRSSMNKEALAQAIAKKQR
ncbi:ChaB family protein [Aquabacterium sp. A7-Y]|uniref:ChaB family protein n=1 Tax=Aquabacterium sp. A7-Y TaxID=1349605 RepID=UPI00223D7730|nr:ChaB family protein [Aquabacterium sp. A7-Y]MCW7537949.1 ChaB family protein [Aquabacterium sp. A7-Y]